MALNGYFTVPRFANTEPSIKYSLAEDAPYIDGGFLSLCRSDKKAYLTAPPSGWAILVFFLKSRILLLRNFVES